MRAIAVVHCIHANGVLTGTYHETSITKCAVQTEIIQMIVEALETMKEDFKNPVVVSTFLITMAVFCLVSWLSSRRLRPKGETSPMEPFVLCNNPYGILDICSVREICRSCNGRSSPNQV